MLLFQIVLILQINNFMDLMLGYPFNNNTQYDLQVGQKTCQIVDLGNIGEDKKYLYELN